ncbi:MAG: porphobilinogen synthase, partial [Chlamydiota bacterium]
MLRRPRRLRYTDAISSLVQETRLHAHDLVLPLFILPGSNQKESIKSMPGCERLSLDLLLKELTALHKKGLQAVALFPVIDKSLKDLTGSYGLREDGILPRALTLLKKELPELCLISDVALDPYTCHGHDGLLN